MAGIIGHQAFNPLPLGLKALHLAIQLHELFLRRPAIDSIVIRNPPIEVGTHPPIRRTLPGGRRVVRQIRQSFLNLSELVSKRFLLRGHEESRIFVCQRRGNSVREVLVQLLPLVCLLGFECPTGLGNTNLPLLLTGLQHDPERFKPGLPLGDEGLHSVEFVQFGKRLLERLRSQHFCHTRIEGLHAQPAIGICKNPVAVTAELKLGHQTFFIQPIPDIVELPDTGLVMVGCLFKRRQCTLWSVHLLKNIGAGKGNLLAPGQKQFTVRESIKGVESPLRPALARRGNGVVKESLIGEHAGQWHGSQDLQSCLKLVITQVQARKREASAAQQALPFGIWLDGVNGLVEDGDELFQFLFGGSYVCRIESGDRGIVPEVKGPDVRFVQLLPKRSQFGFIIRAGRHHDQPGAQINPFAEKIVVGLGQYLAIHTIEVLTCERLIPLEVKHLTEIEPGLVANIRRQIAAGAIGPE